MFVKLSLVLYILKWCKFITIMATESRRQIRNRNLSQTNEALRNIIDKVSAIENTLSKKKKKKALTIFIIFQILGTLTILSSWTIQNTIINNINSQTSNYYKTRTEMFSLEGKLSQEQLTINLLHNNALRFSDSSVTANMNAREAYFSYIMTLVTQMRLALSLVAIGDKISPSSNVIMTKNLKDSIEMGCAEVVEKAKYYYYPFNRIDSLNNLQFLTSITYQPQKNDLMTIAELNNLKKEERRNEFSPLFLCLYIIGSIMIVLSIGKEFMK